METLGFDLSKYILVVVTSSEIAVMFNDSVGSIHFEM